MRLSGFIKYKIIATIKPISVLSEKAITVSFKVMKMCLNKEPVSYSSIVCLIILDGEEIMNGSTIFFCAISSHNPIIATSKNILAKWIKKVCSFCFWRNFLCSAELLVLFSLTFILFIVVLSIKFWSIC